VIKRAHPSSVRGGHAGNAAPAAVPALPRDPAAASPRPRSRPGGERTWTCSLACEFVFGPFPPCRVFRLIPECQRCALGYQRAGSCLALRLPSPVHHARRLRASPVMLLMQSSPRLGGLGEGAAAFEKQSAHTPADPRPPGLLGAAEPAVRWPGGAVLLARGALGTHAMLGAWGGTACAWDAAAPSPGVDVFPPSEEHLYPQVQLRGVCGARGWQELPEPPWFSRRAFRTS